MGKKNRNTRGPPLTVDVMPPQGKTSSTSVTPATSGTSVKASDGTKEKEGALSVAEVPESESCMVRLMCKATDENSFKTFVQAWNKEGELRESLWEANKNTMYEDFEKLIVAKKLDSNLKKCTSFVRKMKQYTESQKASIESDIKTLNLSKYLTEIAAAVTEARLKMENITDVVTICSLIHQRYQEFAGMLMENFRKNLPTKRSEMVSSAVSKHSVDIRMIGELVICGVFPVTEGCHLLLSVVKNMIASDKEGMQCLVPIMSFAVGLGDAFLGVLPRRICKMSLEYGVILKRLGCVPPEVKNGFKNAIMEYFSTVSSALVKLHQEKQKSELYNRKLMKTRGEISQERKDTHAAVQAKFDKYLVTASKFADSIDCDLPELTELPADPEEEEEKALLRSESGEIMDFVPGIIIFEDEETRSFYQDFKDLKVYLPPVAYRESIQQVAEETQQIEEREKALNDFDDEAETAEFEETDIQVPVEEEPTETESELPPSLRIENEEKEGEAPIKPTFQDFLDKLPNCCGRASIDRAALEFAESHNTKINRKKLVQTLFKVPRQRIDLLPFYSRLVAILNPVMPEVGLELCRLLKNDLYFLVKKKHQIFIETKLKIVRFIGELVNFKIFPKSDALHSLKMLLMNFTHHQIEMACVLVETCGRFLHRTPDSHRRMKIYLEEMMRKKTARRLEARYNCMIDHAFFIVCPPEAAPRVEKKLTAIELFLRPILKEDLAKSTYRHALAILKCLPWDDVWVSEVACRYLSRPWSVTHQQMQLQAQLLMDLAKFEPHSVTRVIDIMMEELRRGLENPGVLYNDRRFATLTYLAELYYYRLVRSDTLFDVMFFLITFGVVWDRSKAPSKSMDPPESVNRIRLSIFLLKECGEFLNHGSNKKRLRLYLIHLQKYIWLKRSLPVWNNTRFPFGVHENFEEIARKLYPRMKFATSYENAVEILTDMEGEDRHKLPKLMPVSDTTGMLPFMDPMQKYNLMQEELAAAQLKQRAMTSGRFNGGSGLAANAILEMDEDGMDPYDRASSNSRQGHRQNLSPEDEEFNALFDKMCSDYNYAGKQMKTEITIPLHISNSFHSGAKKTSNPEPEDPSMPPGTVPFVMITRKGTKQQYKTLPLPEDSDFVKRIRSREELERAEKESVKQRTLAISQLQEQEERQRELDAIKSAFNFPYSGNRGKV